MNWIVTSDLQAGLGSSMCFNQPDMPLQRMRVKKFFVELHRVFQEEKCQCLVDLGDLTDDRGALPLPVISDVLEGTDKFPARDLNIKLIGNHEQYQRSGLIHTGRLFAHKFTVVSQCDSYEIDESTVVICAAYPPNDEALQKWIAGELHQCRGYRRKVLLGHFQVAGCAMPSGTAVTGLPLRILEPFDLVLLGHVHKPQSLTDKVHYVGSPFQQDFGEKNEAKRVGILDTKTLELKWVPLPGFPEYRVVGYDEFCKRVRAEEEHRYQVILKGTEEAEKFYAHPLMSRAEPVYDFCLTPETEAEETAPKTWSMEAAMERYVRANTPETVKITPEELLEYGKALARPT